MARIVEADDAGIGQAAKFLQEGGCVAFPTETVYGLGANAKEEKALLNIFKFKERPLSDPLIVHILTPEEAGDVVVIDDYTRPIFEALSHKFWPGPLTIILKARDHMPSQLSARTGFIGVRCPVHPITRRLLEKAALPVAAPSANKFGHVSPTTCEHVYNDLSACPIIIVKGESSSTTSQSDPTCSVGIESTVVKVAPDGQSISLLRFGGTSVSSLESALKQTGLGHVSVHCPPEDSNSYSSRATAATSASQHQATEHDSSGSTGEKYESPGQLIRHYAPNVNTFLLPPRTALAPMSGNDSLYRGTTQLKSTGLIDFAGAYKDLENDVKYYVDLSVEGDIVVARQNLYKFLRHAEQVDGLNAILLSLPALPSERGSQERGVPKSNGDHTESLRDRLFRAASGTYLDGQNASLKELWYEILERCEHTTCHT